MVAAASVLAYAAFGILVGLCFSTSAMAFVLKRRFPAEWEYWGEPNEWLWLQRTSLSRHVLAFLQDRSYTRTGDKNFVRFCDVIRIGWYLGLILLPVATIFLGISLISLP
jgi:hypothetical protein